MNTIGIIPARMSATRFPGKPLARIKSMPMLGHVYKRAKLCSNLSDVYVATCDEVIKDYVLSINGKVTMTSHTHQRATDRTSEAVSNIMEHEQCNIDNILMIQGDEPLLNPKLLDQMIRHHEELKSPYITNLITEIQDIDEFQNPNVIKVVMNKNNDILYLSRSPIPSSPVFNGEYKFWKQLGIILFTQKSLNKYTKLAPTKLEILESVDMNRMLENNFRINTFFTLDVSQAVDIPADIKLVEAILEHDELLNLYAQ